MSTFSKVNAKVQEELRKERIEQKAKDRAEKEIHAETEQFIQETLKGLPDPTPEQEVYTRALMRQVVLVLRGYKGRIEQLGGHVTQMSAVAHQSWDCTQVTLNAVVKQLIKTYEEVDRLKEILKVMAKSDTTEAKDVAYKLASIDPAAFGFRDKNYANIALVESTQELVSSAHEAAQRGEGHTAESQAREVLSEIMKEHSARGMQDLPQSQDLLKVTPSGKDKN
jgi:hypothetical protein